MSVPMSLVVATAKPWPRLAPLLDAVRSQARAAGAEVLVADGDGDGVPDDIGEPFVVVRRPGADVFLLRAEAITHARGAVVALLEDHSYPDPDYCSRVVKAFEEHPDMLGIVGTARNGAPKPLDDASFLLTWAPFLAPLTEVPSDRCAPPGVVAFRRSALPAAPPPPGWLEYELSAQLRRDGRLVADDRVRVNHVQHLGARAFPIQFHAGRGYGGLTHEPRASIPRGRRVREALGIPATLMRQTAEGTRRSNWPHRRRSLALVAVLAACNSAGQVVGVLTGPGKSTSHLE